MHNLITTAHRILKADVTLPFSLYSSFKEQQILNVPIIKPLLICILNGRKQLGSEGNINCPAGTFVFLSNSPQLKMRNIPQDDQYQALLVEFEFDEFKDLPTTITPSSNKENWLAGDISNVLEHTLKQFMEWSVLAPQSLWHLRRKEILHTFYETGYQQLSQIVESPQLSHRVHALISSNLQQDLTAPQICSILAMSESTLRRRLQTENTNLQSIKEKVKLTSGLHLVQTTMAPIGAIAEQCGYQSQSRFTDKFKQQFGLTPSELRKTRLAD